MDTSKEARPDPLHYPRGGTYADFLAWHLFYWGTREDGDTAFNGEPWKKNDFVLKAFDVGGANSARVSIRNWLAEAKSPNSAPDETGHGLIKTALFGANPKFKDWREDLDQARERSTIGRNRRTKKFPDPPPIPLPIQATTASIPDLTRHFMGRDEERDRLVEAIISHDEGQRAFLVQGGPGMGKTELTKAVAHHAKIVTLFGERRFFVRLETVSTALAMQDAILRAVGLDHKLELQSAFQSRHGEQILLILDNLEKAWETMEGRDETEMMLKELCEVPGVSVLASFRGLDFVDGPIWNPIKLSAFSTDTSKALFSAIAGQWVETDACLDNFITALGGIPLAINLVARRAYNRTSLKPLWHEWQKIGAPFARHVDLPEDAITSLSHSIELSLKSPRIQKETGALRLFGFLGCLPAGLSGQDRTSLLGENSYRAEECLFNAGLAVSEMDRINLLPPIREYAKRCHPLLSQDNRLWIEFFLNKVQNIFENLGKFETDHAFLEIFHDIDNINLALIHIISNDLGISFNQYLDSYIILVGMFEFRIDVIIGRLKSYANILPLQEVANLELLNAIIMFRQGNLIDSRDIIIKNYILFKEVDNKIGMALSCFYGGSILSALDQDTEAAHALEEALEHFTALSDVAGQDMIERALISAFSHVGRFDEAIKLINKHSPSINENESIHQKFCNLAYFTSCGDFEICQKNNEKAIFYYKKSLDYAGSIGSVKLEIDLLLGICRLYAESGQIEMSYIYAKKAMELCQSVGDIEKSEMIQNAIIEQKKISADT